MFLRSTNRKKDGKDHRLRVRLHKRWNAGCIVTLSLHLTDPVSRSFWGLFALHKSGPPQRRDQLVGCLEAPGVEALEAVVPRNCGAMLCRRYARQQREIRRRNTAHGSGETVYRRWSAADLF